MILLKNTSEKEEFFVKGRVIAIARKIIENFDYTKEFIIEVCGLTEEGYEEVIKRATIMDCARRIIDEYRIDYLQQKLNLNEEELKDLINYKKEKREK